MKIIKRDTDYAIKALIHIARKDSQIIPVSKLAKRLNIPQPFLRKILQILNKEGVIHSSKGKGGGFRLALPPGEISLVKLIEIFQGPVKFNDCLFRKNICLDIQTCPLKKRIDALENHMIAELQSTTLASLLEDAGDEICQKKQNPQTCGVKMRKKHD